MKKVSENIIVINEKINVNDKEILDVDLVIIREMLDKLRPAKKHEFYPDNSIEEKRMRENKKDKK